MHTSCAYHVSKEPYADVSRAGCKKWDVASCCLVTKLVCNKNRWAQTQSGGDQLLVKERGRMFGELTLWMKTLLCCEIWKYKRDIIPARSRVTDDGIPAQFVETSNFKPCIHRNEVCLFPSLMNRKETSARWDRAPASEDRGVRTPFGSFRRFEKRYWWPVKPRARH